MKPKQGARLLPSHACLGGFGSGGLALPNATEV